MANYIQSWVKDNYYTAKVQVPKEKKEVLQELSKATGKSINRLFIDAIEKQYNVDLTLTDKRMGQSE